MAKQTGPIKFEGTIDNITGYRVNGIYYLKKKSSVSRKRILTDKRYSNTRRNAAWFARAQKLAAAVYRELAPGQRDLKNIWYPLRNRAQELVRKELPVEKIIHLLQKEFIKLVKATAKKKQAVKASPLIEPPAKANKIADEIFLGRTVNKELEYKLVDHLAASYSFLTKLLDTSKQNDTFKTERRALAGTLKKFRR